MPIPSRTSLGLSRIQSLGTLITVMLVFAGPPAAGGAPAGHLFGPDGTLRSKGFAEPRPMGGSPEDVTFLPNTRVDDDIHDEHREPAVAWGPDDELYAVYCERATHYNPEFIMFSRSTSGGQSWLPEAIRVNDTTPNATMMPAIGVLEDGTIVVAWCELKFAPYNDEIRFSRSTDGGDTWSPSVVVHPINPNANYYRPSLLIAEGRILVSYWQGVAYPNGYPLVVTSDDGGLTWNAPIIITTAFGPYDGAAPCLAYNADIPAVGMVMPTANEQVVFCQSEDLGDSWSDPVPVSDAVASSVDYPDLDCFGGVYHVVWMDNRYGQYDTDVFVSRSTDGMNFTPSVKVNDNFQGNQYEPHIRCGADGNLHICWIWCMPFQSEIDLYYSQSTDGGETWLQPAPRINDVPYIVQPYVAWTSDLLADTHSNAFVFWNDGRRSGYYDNVYFSRSVVPGAIDEELDPASAHARVRVLGQPGPTPILRLELTEPVADLHLEMIDVSGRRLCVSTLGSLGVGVHLLAPGKDRIPPVPRGVWYARLRCGTWGLAHRVLCVR